MKHVPMQLFTSFHVVLLFFNYLERFAGGGLSPRLSNLFYSPPFTAHPIEIFAIRYLQEKELNQEALYIKERLNLGNFRKWIPLIIFRDYKFPIFGQ